MKPDLAPLLGQSVTVTVDRPLGTRHPDFPETVYPVNYGYLADRVGGDGEAQDAYILGVDRPLDCFCGNVIAIIRRTDDCEDKLIVAPRGVAIPPDEIEAAVAFTERYFPHVLMTLGG